MMWGDTDIDVGVVVWPTIAAIYVAIGVFVGWLIWG